MKALKDRVPTTVIRRLPCCYRYLSGLLEENVEHISSSDLATRTHVTVSQVCQDLNTFDGFGQQGYGYYVPHLYAEIGKLLGISQQKCLVIIGTESFGQALANYQNFTKHGFQVRALFGIDPEVISRTIQGAQASPLEYLEAYLEKNTVDVATLTLPRDRAVEVIKRLCRCGIKAIWNFAHTDLQVDEDVLVEGVHFSESLMQLFYRAIATRRKQKRTEEMGDTGTGERSD